MADLDFRLLRWLTCDLDAPWLDDVVPALDSEPFGALVFAALAGFALLSARARARAPRAAVALVLAMGGVHLVKEAVWRLAPRERPTTALPRERLLEGVVDRPTCASRPGTLAVRAHRSRHPSFPSSHTVSAAAAAAVLTCLSAWAGALGWVYALAVGVGRLYWAKHWPSDVLGSLLVAAAVGALAWRLAPRLPPLGARRSPGGPPAPPPSEATGAQG